jgi:hypothetical protein
MIYKKLLQSIILLMLIGITNIHAQDAIATTGKTLTGTGGSVSYTVGQVSYTTNTSTSGTMLQGVQVPFEISVIDGINEAAFDLMYSAYPNPTSGTLTLKTENINIENHSYQLFDISGKLLDSRKIESNETIIYLEAYTSSTYFLKITKGNETIKTFKIIKN